MASPSGVCLGFLLLLLCIAHGSARNIVSDDLMPNELKRQLNQESMTPATELLEPERESSSSRDVPSSLSDSQASELLKEDGSNESLEDSPAPESLDDDQVACGHPLCRVRPRLRPPPVVPNCPSCGCAPATDGPIPFPYPRCQPASPPEPFYPPQPAPQPEPFYPPQHSEPLNPLQPAPQPEPFYPPQPAPQPEPFYPPQPAPQPEPFYPPQPAPAYPPQPLYPPQPAPAYPPQVSPGCEPASPPEVSPGCEPASPCAPAASPPEVSPGCEPASPCAPAASPCAPAASPCQPEPTYPAWPEYPPQPEPFYPPQPEPFNPPITGPRVDGECVTLLGSECSGSTSQDMVQQRANEKPPPNKDMLESIREMEDGGSINEQDSP